MDLSVRFVGFGGASAEDLLRPGDFSGGAVGYDQILVV